MAELSNDEGCTAIWVLGQGQPAYLRCRVIPKSQALTSTRRHWHWHWHLGPAGPAYNRTPLAYVFMPRANAQHRTLSNVLQPYESEREFMNDLKNVLEQDYGITLCGHALEEAGQNINHYLRSFL